MRRKRSEQDDASEKGRRLPPGWTRHPSVVSRNGGYLVVLPGSGASGLFEAEDEEELDAILEEIARELGDVEPRIRPTAG